MNKVLLCARLVKDVDLKFVSGTGKAVGSVTVAVTRNYKNKEGKYESDFINCKVFDKKAETLAQYVGKGQQVILEGSWRTGSYEKDGTKIYTNEMYIDNFHFLQGQPKAEKQESVPEVFKGAEPAYDDDNLPF